MSGGVDSSVVACLLKEAGYEVIGITLQLYDYGEALRKKGACCAGQDVYDAKKVAEKINIPHYVLNYESLFKQEVMEDFADSYTRGETPIPCVRCNQTVKFRDLLKAAKMLNADALATGHYVRKSMDEMGNAIIQKGIDEKKDQSYFLFATTKEQADFLHFPLGNLTKPQVREEARRFNIEVANKPDSQDICFVPNGNYVDIVQKLRPESLKEGDIIHIETGEKLRKHQGIINFTIGQRRGLDIGGSQTPLYVVKIDPKANIVYVGEEQHLYKKSLYVKDFNWLGRGDAPKDGLRLDVKLRYAHKPTSAVVYNVYNMEQTGIKELGDKSGDGRLASGDSASGSAAEGNLLRIELEEGQKSITPGQACVFYDKDRLLGGGFITRKH